MKKKNLKKLLMAVCCAALLVCVSIGATVAYLTSKDEVTNTFTVGKVAITLDELETNIWGVASDATRTDSNTYKLMPGHTYIKDPTVHVTAGSEASWIFVKVENGIADYEAETSTEEGGYKNIAAQIVANGWTKLSVTDADVYYKQHNVPARDTGTDYQVFGRFKIADNADSEEGWSGISIDTTKVIVTAYAIQLDGFENKPADAWDAVKDTATNTQSDT